MRKIPLATLSFALSVPFPFYSILWTKLYRLAILLACVYNHLKTKTCAYTSMNEKYNCINKVAMAAISSDFRVAVAAISSKQRSGSEFRTLGNYQENPQSMSPAGAAACCRRPLSPRPAAAVRPSTAPSSVARSPPHPYYLASCRRRANCLGLHRSWASCLVCVGAGSISTGCYWPKCPTAGCVGPSLLLA